MNIKLGNFEKEIDFAPDLATCLEFIILWGESSEDTVQLLRLNSAAVGVALDHLAILPKYRPERDKIHVYGRVILQRLLEKNVPSEDIYKAGSQVLTKMLSCIPSQDKVEEKEDFFCSPDQDG